MGGIVVSQSIRIGGDEIDEAIITWVKKEYNLLLGDRTAEQLKMAIGSAWPFNDEPNAEIRGRDLITGLPKTVVVTAADVREAIEEPVQQVVDAIKFCLDKTPPELAADMMERGIILRRRRLAAWPRSAGCQRDRDSAGDGGAAAAVGRHRIWHVPRGVRRPSGRAHLDRPNLGMAPAAPADCGAAEAR